MVKEDSLVLIKYSNPENQGIESRPGYIKEGANHYLIIKELAEKTDVYSYTIIPKSLVEKILPLKVEDK